MSQMTNDGRSLFDPLGIMDNLRQVRDAQLEAWSKIMIDIVSSDAYAQATGRALAESLAVSQPARQALERSMTTTLEALNMPSRTEVISIAERLVNVEMRLDDLDAKLTAYQKALPAAVQSVVRTAVRDAVQEVIQDAVKEAVRQAMTTPTRHLRELETHLTALDTQVAAIQQAVTPTAPPNEKVQEG
jgi:seryl-tRNA synthetase